MAGPGLRVGADDQAAVVTQQRHLALLRANVVAVEVQEIIGIERGQHGDPALVVLHHVQRHGDKADAALRRLAGQRAIGKVAPGGERAGAQHTQRLGTLRHELLARQAQPQVGRIGAGLDHALAVFQRDGADIRCLLQKCLELVATLRAAAGQQQGALHHVQALGELVFQRAYRQAGQGKLARQRLATQTPLHRGGGQRGKQQHQRHHHDKGSALVQAKPGLQAAVLAHWLPCSSARPPGPACGV